MRIFKYLYITLLILSFGCTDDFEDMNKKPDGLVEVNNPNYLLLSSLTRGYSDSFQRATNLYHDLYSQHLANLVTDFDTGFYLHHDAWIMSKWRNFYSRYIIKNALYIEELYNKDPRNNNVYQVSQIWKYFMTSIMVDTWGDIPYSEAGKGGYSVKYDDAETIYRTLIDGLADAAQSFKDDESQIEIDATYDPVYGGDIEKWKKFANTIRARLALRMVNFDAEYSKKNVVEALNNGCILNNSENCYSPCDGTKVKNKYKNFAGWKDKAMSKTIENILKNESNVVDPRMKLWFAKASGDYVGIENGYPSPTKSPEKWSILNKKYWTFDMPFPIALASDTKFIMAEAVLRGWISGDIKDLVDEGILDNMEFWGVDGNEAEEYVNNLNALPGDNEGKLKYIITQRWLAHFCNGHEGWAVARRTDYPALQPPLLNLSNTVPD